MSHLHRPPVGLQEPETATEPTRSPFADVAGRFANWITGMERIPEDEADEDMMDQPMHDPMRQLTVSEAAEEASRFPVAALGYNRAAVDEYILGLEREIAELRAREPKPMSINEELARIGEQTASILVVAHNQASETTRLAEEQAERCVADAAANAVAITKEAKQRLREIDTETDSVWRERERLLQDMRDVSQALASLADEATARFPSDGIADGDGTVAIETADPQATVAFTPAEHAEYGEYGEMQAAEEEHGTHDRSGETATWLIGLEPPDSLA